MIPSLEFTRAFDGAFEPGARRAGLIRRRGRASRWGLVDPGGDLQLQFRVNPRASAIPHSPGEFWPVVTWEGPRHGPRDDGAVSFYQYTTPAENEAIHALVVRVIDKVRRQDDFAHEALRTARDALLAAIDLDLDRPPEPRLPSYALYYLDAADAAAWGAWFGETVSPWIERFRKAPESLEAWSWRVLWKDLPGPA